MNKRKQFGFGHLIPVVVIVLLVAVIGVFVITNNKSKTENSSAIDLNNLPKILQADAVKLDNFTSITKFRSGVGHDFNDRTESCRSMKHYFYPNMGANAHDPTDAELTAFNADSEGVPMYSPVDGTITDIVSETKPIGKQFYITPSANSSFTIRLFHVFPLSTVSKGMKVTAGQKIGAIMDGQATDIAVRVRAGGMDHFVSYFDIMPDDLFAKYQSRGVTSRSELVIPKAERDTNPLTCNGEMFTSSSDGQESDYMRLSGYLPQPKHQ